jgi:hypothetical protein
MASEEQNVLRTLTMLEKALDRLGRLNYLGRNQYPPIFLTVEETINKMKLWIRGNSHFSSVKVLYQSLSELLAKLTHLVAELWDSCKSKPGKKAIKKFRKILEKQSIFESIRTMISNIDKSVQSWRDSATTIGVAIEKGTTTALIEDVVKGFVARIRDLLSQRGEKTYVFPCKSAEEYSLLIADNRRFVEEVVDKLESCPHSTGHKPGCQGIRQYCLCGFRKNPRRTVMPTGKQETFPIRMIRCKTCGQRFSLLPSFLPREKNFGIDIIGNVARNLFLFQLSTQGALQNTALMGKGRVKSKQTIFNWIRWLGTHHPATILTRAGVTGSGYLQEDEGFEKEPNLRTYSVVMVDPRNLLVWHADYVDHVDEKTLIGSFQQFLERTCFSILGVNKDKWRPSTEALKKVFHKIWIGYCHRHCLKRFSEALEEYRQQTNCSRTKVSELYKKFKRILKTSTSKVNLETRIKLLDEEEFLDPILRARLDELKENAVYYTAHKQRKGIAQTTSMVDNYLKLVKRKLRQVESFRDKQWTTLFFKGQANTRNFVPFSPGAKNAGRSPFSLAGGKTYDLPWIQAMNVHNAFLFCESAL